MFLANPFLPPLNSDFCSSENSMLLPRCAASRLSKKAYGSWTRTLVGASEISTPLGGILAVTSPNTFVGAACRES